VRENRRMQQSEVIEIFKCCQLRWTTATEPLFRTIGVSWVAVNELGVC